MGTGPWSGGLAFVAIALALALGWASAKGQEAPGPSVDRGRQIYRLGTSALGYEVIATVGSEAVALPASAVPCASCHGRDGLGRPEGGVIPPDIRWSQLTKVYGHVHENGREHPAFDVASLDRLIRSGVDPGGNRVDAAMPLYSMTGEDMADLIAYIRNLEHERDPGVTEDRVQVATLLPLTGPQGATGSAMALVLQGYFDDLNANGGVFQRRIELLVVPYGATAEEALHNLRLALEHEDVFAVVGAYTIGLDAPLLELLRREHVPLVGPFTLDPGDEILNTGAFYIYSGLSDQTGVLAKEALQAGEGKEEGPLLVVGPKVAQTDRLAAAVRAKTRDLGAPDPVVVTYAPGAMNAAALADQVANSRCQSLLFFGSQSELDTLLPVLAERRLLPRVYLLGALVSASLLGVPDVFNRRIFLAYPTLTEDISAAGRVEYQTLAQRHGFPRDHIQGQITALAAGKLLVEGLKRTGRDLSRERLEDAMEKLYDFRTGLTPPLTYSPTRRIGARGAHVMVVDMKAGKKRAAGTWVDLN